MVSTSAGSAAPAGDSTPQGSVVSRRAVSRRGVLGMAALGAASLTGACDSSSSGSTVGGKARVRLWTWYTQQRGQWPQLIKEFEESHPTITVQNRLFGDPDSYLPALESTVSSGDVPEIFAPHVLAIQYGRSGVAADLRAGLGATFLDAFYPSTNEEYSDNGKQYALGWMAQTFGIFYDPRILSRAKTDIPQTWDDLIEVAGKVTALGKQPCLLSNNPGTNGLDFFLPLVTQASDDRRLLLDIDRQQHGKTWNDPHVVAALRKLDQLLSAGAFAPNANGITTDQAESALYTGKAAMLYMGSWVPQDFTQSAPKDFIDHYQVMPTPAWAPGKGLVMNYLVCVGSLVVCGHRGSSGREVRCVEAASQRAAVAAVVGRGGVGDRAGRDRVGGPGVGCLAHDGAGRGESDPCWPGGGRRAGAGGGRGPAGCRGCSAGHCRSLGWAGVARDPG
jgi:ABC-type glycerol-3-phosphate transport system substrate-binding protein